MSVRLASSLISASAAALASVSAAAQARLEPVEAPSGGDVELTVVVDGAACGPAGAAAFRLDVPEGLLKVRPRPADGRRMTVEEGALEYIYSFRGALISSGVKTVEWRAERPDAGEATFELRAAVAPLPAGDALIFAAEVICADGGARKVPSADMTLTVAAPRAARL